MKCSPKESPSLRGAKMETFGGSAQTCRNRHPCLQYRIFQMFVCFSVRGGRLQKQEAAATSADFVTVHRVSPSMSAVGVYSVSEQVVLYSCLVTAP